MQDAFNVQSVNTSKYSELFPPSHHNEIGEGLARIGGKCHKIFRGSITDQTEESQLNNIDNLSGCKIFYQFHTLRLLFNTNFMIRYLLEPGLGLFAPLLKISKNSLIECKHDMHVFRVFRKFCYCGPKSLKYSLKKY